MKLNPIQIQRSSAHFQSLLGSDPMLITAQGHQSLKARLQQLTGGDIELVVVEKKGDRDEIEVERNVAIIPVKGVIAKGLEDWEKEWFGMVDVDDVRRNINEAQQLGVDTIILDIDSPGGFATGVHELAGELASVGLLTVAFTESQMGSAAYYLGAATKHIVSSQTAVTGSVGVYSVMVDSSEAYRQAGYKVEVIRSGDHKGLDVDGAAISQEAKDQVQSLVDARGEAFREFVATNRPQIDFVNLQGQVFMGNEALEAGFVDALANSKDDLIVQLVD